ncbi:MAG: right-handed parallel beta-helix repeat-containing protein [Candidatus Bathyarchaeota archaeon]|nr:right-handed parallel beta-helix repeat-containing protein [Candidatus Bathyarchaeota archaeon]
MLDCSKKGGWQGKIAVRSFVLAILLFVMFSNLTSAAFSYGNYDAAVIIREDGGVEGTNLILRSGNVYSLTGDIIISQSWCPAGIQVLKDNVVIDGSNHSILINGEAGMGVDLTGRHNVVVKNLSIRGFNQAVYLDNSTQNMIDNNVISGNSRLISCGVWATSSWNNSIIGNRISTQINDNPSSLNFGILIQAASTGNVIEGNTIENSTVGIDLSYCPNNTLRKNAMVNNKYSFALEYNTYEQFVQDIDTSNTIDGKPIYYWLNEHDKSVPSDAGFVALGNCENITIKNIQISRTYDSISLINTKNSKIANNAVVGCANGIFLKYCENIEVSKNSLINNTYCGVGTVASSQIQITENNLVSCGIGLSTSGYTNRHVGGGGSSDLFIAKNNFTDNDSGIYFALSKNSSAEQNFFLKNTYGINLISSTANTFVKNLFLENSGGAVRISGAVNNTFYLNSFINNAGGGTQIFNPWIVLGNPEDNVWDFEGKGNYWSDFTQRYPNATALTGKGVWDTPYYINSKNIDNYPLVSPNQSNIVQSNGESGAFTYLLITIPIAIGVAILAVYRIMRNARKCSTAKLANYPLLKTRLTSPMGEPKTSILSMLPIPLS